ncbi:hypothetical protein [Acinetobacter indicus]|uniref:defense against restriction DarA-related protein n=1 Tax=Acinetobacter indicus TaxID=756892 RepID=UPI00209A97E6|nr:hypothetical protein [Acinetobacter indicus]MCO8088247.1 hypothetical protein [Acinetobacter indicus]
MFDNPLFVPQFVTGQAIKLRTQDGVMIDSCDANIGYLQGDVRKIKAILCDGAHESDQWQVINLVRPDGTFYDHIAVKGAVSQDQAERLCQKYFLQGQGDYRFQDHVPVSDNSLKMFMDSTVTPTGTSFFLLADAVAYDARATQQPVIWDDENRLQSHGGHIAQVMYDMARYDANQDLLTKVTPKDVVSMLLDENCTLVMYDAMIMKYRQLDMAMKKLAEALKTSDHEEFFVKSVTPIEPFKRLGVVNVGVIFEMSDTQTVTVLFNNPDTTPGKITDNDVITSWKWILNKRDVTAVLQPRAVDAKKYPLIASRMFKLLAQNHSRFKRAQALRAKDEALLSELMGQLEAAQSESNSLDAELARIDQEIDQVGVRKQQQSALEKDSKKDGEVVAKSGQDPELEAAISKVKAITELLISDFDFSYNQQSQSTNLIKELISANGYDVSIEIEDDFSINLDGEIVLDRVDTTGSIEYIARAIAQADFEHKQDFSETGEIEDKDSIFFGKSSDYAFTIQQLDQAAKQLKLDIVYDNFEATKATSAGLFDSLNIAKANLIYGVTAQIGKNNQVLARASVDFDGNLELLRGASGSDVIKSFNTDKALKKNIVETLSDLISGNPIASESVEQAADSGDEALIHLGYLERQADEPTQVEDTASATVFEPTITRYSIKSTNPRARKPVGSIRLTTRPDGMSDVLFSMDGVGGEYVGTIEDVKKWVAMRMQGLGSALEGKDPSFEDIAPRLDLVEGEDLLGVEVQVPADDPAPVSENEQFLNDLIAGLVDLAADETGARLESMAEGLDPALESLFEQAAEAYAQFAINNAKTV